MKQFILKNKKALCLLGFLLLMGGITMSFQDSPLIYQKLAQEQMPEDTYPSKKLPDSMNSKVCDEYIKDLISILMEADAQIKRIDIAQIQQDIKMAHRNININRAILKTTTGLKSGEIEKMRTELVNTMKGIKNALNNTKKEILKTYESK